MHAGRQDLRASGDPATWTPRHIVQFYEDDGYLCDMVAGFLAAGLGAGEATCVIAAEERRAAIVEQLRAHDIDVAGARQHGRLHLFDARATLERFMVGGAPDSERFTSAVGDGILGAIRHHAAGKPVRVYGEMVDLLFRDGHADAALRIEELWNGIGARQPLSLLCAYDLSHFIRASDGDRFSAVCLAHGHVVPAESYVALTSADARARQVSALQQRGRALENEIAHRRLLEESLRVSRAELEDFVENAAEGLHWLGADGRILWANRADLELLGYARHEYIGHHIAEFHVDREVIDDMLARLARDETLRDYEARLRTKDGEIRDVLINSNVLWRDGTFVHSRCFTRDITARKQAEAHAETARKEAEAAARAKDEFLAMLGHELRNPLAPIVTALQIMKLKGDVGSTREQQVIERQVDHLVHLVDDLLDVSRITRGKVALKRETLELAPVVARAVEIASPLLEERQHHFTVEVPRSGLRLSVDPMRLTQVLSNLLTNAAKYTEPGGVITLSAWREGHEIVVATRDNGIGIDPSLLPHVFDLFVQGPRASDRAQGGLGLGLTLVRTLVELHGGTVAAKSDGIGRGSEFVVRLPACAPGEAGDATPAARPSQQSSGTQRRVLVVDDNVDASDLLGEMLRDAGHEVVVVHDGAQALRAVETFLPEVAVLDIGLPVMDGYELAERLRERLGGATPVMIAVTGYGQEHDRARSRHAGFAEHFVKPIMPAKLLSFIDHTGR
jgi:PAS domain S-box-containing protein